MAAREGRWWQPYEQNYSDVRGAEEDEHISELTFAQEASRWFAREGNECG